MSPISEPAGDEIAVSGIGTVAVARVKPEGAPPFIAVSMYADEFGIVPASHFGAPWHIERRSDVVGDQAFATRYWQVWRLSDSDYVQGIYPGEYRSLPEQIPILQLSR